MNNFKKGGLQPTPKDTRDFQLGAIFQLPPLSELPTDFVLEGFEIKNQGESDFCSGYATTGMSELQEGVILSPEYSFAMSKKLSGDIDGWGQDMRNALKTHTKIGALPQSASPYSTANKPISFLRDPANWPDTLLEQAKPHQKEAYMKVSGNSSLDAFDAIRATIWKWKDEKRSVALGLAWSWPSNAIILEEAGQGFGHMLYIIGFRTINGTPYLVIVNSWGKQAGDQGTHLISMKVINYFEGVYGAYMFVDKTREDIQYMLDNGIKEGDQWVLQLWKILKTLILSPFLTIPEKIEIVKNTTEAIEDIKEKLPHSTAWSGGTLEERKGMYALADRVCNEEGLSPAMKRDLLLTCAGESGFNQWAENKNRNGSGDFGIMQFNSDTYLKEYKMTPEEAKNNPEKCLRISARNFLGGRAPNWFAYKGRDETLEQAEVRREKNSSMLELLA